MAADQTIDLLQRWHGGDPEALHALVERHLPAFQAHVDRLLGDKLRRKEQTVDFVQQGVLEFLRYSPRFVVGSEKQFFALVVRILENMIRDKDDWYRAKRRAMDREDPLPRDTVLELGPGRSITSPSEAAQREENKACVRLALELLDSRDREIIVLREYEGRPVREIAAQLGIAETAAHMRLKRALARLAEKMQALTAGRLDEALGRLR